MKDVFCSEEEVQTRGVHFTTEEDTFLEDGSEWKHYAGAIERHGELSVWRRLRTIKICRLVEEQMVVVAGFTGKEGKMAINMADEMIRELREKKRMRERKEKGTTKLMDTHMSAQRAVEFETWMKDIEEDRFQEIEDAVYATEGKEALDVGDWCDGVDEEDIDMYNGVSRAPDGVRFMAIKGNCSKLLRIQRRCAQYTEDAHVLKQRSAGIAL